MSLISGDQLRLVAKWFGIPTSQLDSSANLDDGNVSQVTIVDGSTRRQSSEGAACGWYQGVLENVHSGADDEISFIDPYLAAADAVAPYPIAVPEDFDLWCLGVGGIRSSGAGGLTGATMGFSVAAFSQAWGRDDAGAPVVASPRILFAEFDAISEITAAVTPSPMITEKGDIWVPVNMRVPRGSLFTFHSTSAAAAEFQAIFMLGLFPTGLGQDVVT